jgi:hypothetical protein
LSHPSAVERPVTAAALLGTLGMNPAAITLGIGNYPYVMGAGGKSLYNAGTKLATEQGQVSNLARFLRAAIGERLGQPGRAREPPRRHVAIDAPDMPSRRRDAEGAVVAVRRVARVAREQMQREVGVGGGRAALVKPHAGNSALSDHSGGGERQGRYAGRRGVVGH